MMTEPHMTEAEQDNQAVTQSDVDWYVAEVIAPTWESEDASTGWLHALPTDDLIIPGFDLLGEPWA